MEAQIKPIPVSYLAGIHLFAKDFSYANYFGELFNELSQLLGDIQFDHIKIGSTDILKSQSKADDFELKLDGKSIIYQDITDFPTFSKNVLGIIDLWNTVSKNKIKLRLFGIINHFTCDMLSLSKQGKMTLIENFFAFNNSYWSKLNGVDFNLGFVHNQNGRDFNIRITISENRTNRNQLNGFVDFNVNTDNKISGLSSDDIDRVVNNSQEYFYGEFIKLLKNEKL